MGRVLQGCGNGATPERPILSLTQLLDIRAEEQADKPAFHTVIPDDGDDWRIHTLTYAQLRKAIERLAWYYSSPAPGPDLRLPAPSANGENVPPPKTIGLFLNTSLNLTFTEFALHRLGLTSLLISPNNSAPAVASLLEKTDSHTLIYGERLSETVLKAQEILKGKGYELTLIPEKVFPLWGKDGVDEANVKRYPTLLTPEMEHERPCIILHSSGSTGFPKPLSGNHRTVVANGAMNWGLVGATVLPLFHGFGHHSTLRCISAAQPLSVFPPHLPLTAKNILRFFDTVEQQTGIVLEQLFAVAYILKLLSEDEAACKRLTRFELVSFAGSAVPDEVGDKLTNVGVKLLSLFGTTETGGIMSSLRDFDTDKAWNYLALPAGNNRQFVKLVQHGTSESGVFEVVVTKGYPSLAIANQPDGSFATRDLFVFHPTIKDRLKYVGRLDDTLTQTLGEKTNPVPIELTIRGASEYVSQAIVFGDGKPFCGCLILPSDAAKDIAHDRALLMEKVWPAIELANKDAPSHSQIVPEMVEFLPLDAEVPLATKGSILRPSCYAAYKDLIESVYARYESGSSGKPKLALEPPQLEDFLLHTIADTIGEARAAGLKRDDDLFRFGVDSLQCARIRTMCMRELDLGDKKPGENVVYDHPSVAKLAAHLHALRTGAGDLDAEALTKQQHDVMRALVDKYANYLVSHTPAAGASTPSGHVVVLTGATGALGAHIVNQLLSDSKTERVVCLVRARNDEQAAERIRDSFKTRMLPAFDVGENARVVAYAADLDRDDLGLSPEVYARLRDTATAVIQNAWAVNFNLGVESFEADNIRGVANLLNLCLRSPRSRPACFYFSSSVSARQGIWAPQVEEVITDDPAYAAPTGYGRGKWVVEKLCQRAAAEREVHCGVLRIGQMVGDTVNGVWNTTEAIPLLFRSAQVINVLPDIDDYPSFLPIDVAAHGISEIVRAGDRGQTASLYHVVNANMTTQWREMYDFFRAAGLVFDVVDRRAWVERLAEGPSDPVVNPTYKLLDFYRNRYAKPEKLNRSIHFEVKHTAEVAPAIAAAPAVSEELVRKWVARWKEAGFLQ